MIVVQTLDGKSRGERSAVLSLSTGDLAARPGRAGAVLCAALPERGAVNPMRNALTGASGSRLLAGGRLRETQILQDRALRRRAAGASRGAHIDEAGQAALEAALS